MALKELVSRLTGKSHADPDPSRTPAESEEAERLLREYLAEVSAAAARLRHEPWEQRTKDFEAGQAILNAAPVIQAGVVYGIVRRLSQMRWNWSIEYSRLVVPLEDLLRRRLPFTAADHQCFLQTGMARLYPGALIRIVEQCAAEQGLPEATRPLLERLRLSPDPEGRRLQARVDGLLGQQSSLPLQPGEPWSDAVFAHLAAVDAPARAAWEALLAHAFTASAAKASGKWLREAEAHLDRVGREPFAGQVTQWLELSARPPERELQAANADVLKGLVWCCGLYSGAELARVLGVAAETSYRKLPGVGPRSEKIGNACVATLAGMPGPEPVAQLSRLQLRIKHRPALRLLQKAMTEAAQRAGVTPDDLAELSVPTFGMQSPGLLEQPLGEHTAVIEVSHAGIEWRWRSADGKLQKAVPAAVKAEHAEELKALKTQVAELQKQLSAQRDRLERLLLTERSWSLAEWRERYLEHPLLASLTRRLIWHFQDGGRKLLALPHAGRLTDVAGHHVDDLSEATRVRLWHPIGFAPEEVLRWRVWLEEHGVTQPFKQAHREVYLLTDAELNTGTYSNRFAAHLLKQHQAAALARQRGWQYEYLGSWDGGSAGAAVVLPQWGLQAEFWVDAAGGELAASGVALYVSTDQVRFVRLDPGQGDQPQPIGSRAPLALTEVPAVVFTEVMRDVDLFVGVASVGSDPAWRETGVTREQVDYWESYSFGELSASAQTRREVLERLLPRLKIRERCRLDGKFLRVQGELRAYKIHLGSGNILMEPNDQYLCIVPERSGSGADGLFLPFEGDRMLSLVLSKAFLLAEDRKIRDPSITSQIASRT